MKGKQGYNHFCSYQRLWGGAYIIGWYTDSVDRRIRYPKQHEFEVSENEATKFCEHHNIALPNKETT